MAIFDPISGERLDGPNGKSAKSPEPEAPTTETKPEAPAKSSKKD
jgi:hypothetical protein